MNKDGRKSKEFRQYYADEVIMHMNPASIKMGVVNASQRFGEGAPGIDRELQAEVVMTPMVAKRVRDIMAQMIAQYEKNFGSIKTEFKAKGKRPVSKAFAPDPYIR